MGVKNSILNCCAYPSDLGENEMKIKPELEDVAQHVLDNAADYPLLAARCAPLEDVKQHVLDNAADYPLLAARMCPLEDVK